MAIQTANLGTPPSGAGGDTFRSAAAKYNENFTANANAASRLVGEQSGNVMEVGAFGLGGNAYTERNQTTLIDFIKSFGGRTQTGRIENSSAGVPVYSAGLYVQTSDTYMFFSAGYSGTGVKIFTGTLANDNVIEYGLLTSRNTSVDSNGFIKAASPIVKIFSERIELNEEAKQQDPLFEKYDVGHYIIKNTLGFSDLGWYIEMPKDANGNVLVAVQYAQLEDKTIEVRTFAKKFDEETGDIVPNLEKPRDIPVGRWIDIRLQELPQPELVPPVSNTPASFQPTGIAQAVSEMMNGIEQ